MKIASLIVGALAIAASPVWAQQPEAIQDVQVSPYFANGRLQGCVVNFDVAQRDDIYAEGRAVGVSGSLSLYDFGGGRLMALLKLGFLELGGSYQAPEAAYLLDGLRTTADELYPEQVPSETPGFGLFAFRLGEATSGVIGRLVAEGVLAFAYERIGGSSGVPVSLRISEESQRTSYNECVEALLEPYRS